MSLSGIDAVTYGVKDLRQARQFFADFGLARIRSSAHGAVFKTRDGGEVVLRRMNSKSLPPPIENGPTVREVTWGAPTQRSLAAVISRVQRHGPVKVLSDGSAQFADPMGLAVKVRVRKRHLVKSPGSAMNTADKIQRVDSPARIYECAEPVRIGHIVLNVPDLESMEAFYVGLLGFQVSDRYPGRGVFLRCQRRGNHHNLFLLQLPHREPALNHVAFTVRDIHEVFGGGMHLSRAGWETQIGPGRHPISSAYFWYVKNPCGGLAEYFADEDFLTAKWQPREFESKPELFAEWAIDGGLNGHTRRQR